MTLREFAEAWLRAREGQLTPKALQTERAQLRSNILPYLGDRQLRELSRAEIAAWRDWLARGWIAGGRRRGGVQTARRALGVLRTMLRAAADEYALIPESPASRIRHPRPPKSAARARPTAPSLEELCAILRAVPDYDYRLAVACAAVTGLRWGEQFALRPQDLVHGAEGWVLRVRRQRPSGLSVVTGPKTAAGERVVPVPDFLSAPLEQLRGWRQVQGLGLLWPGRRGGWITYGWWRRAVWSPACAAAGCTYHWHHLRHFSASLWIACGWDVAEVADLLGHADPSVTLRVYTHLFRERRRGLRWNLEAVGAQILLALRRQVVVVEKQMG